MPRYKVTLIAELESRLPPDAQLLRTATGVAVEIIAGNFVKFSTTQRGRDHRCAADRVTVDVAGSLAPTASLVGPAVWTVRRTGLLALSGRRTGRSFAGNGDDDGLTGVREPRRPLPPTGSTSLVIDNQPGRKPRSEARWSRLTESNR